MSGADTGGVMDARVRSAPLFSVPVVLLILVVPAIVCARSQTVLFSPQLTIDPWVYFGFFTHLESFKSELFPGTYYGSRLPLILPGYLAYRVLPPLAANYVLHLGTFYLAALSFYYVMAATTARRTALIATVLFAFHPLLWRAVGRDYVDGTGIACYLMAMAAAIAAARHARPQLRLVLAGCAIAALVYCNPAWVLLTPSSAAAYVWFRQDGERRRVRALLQFALFAGTGAAAVTAAFCVVNYQLDGTFWFYAPSVSFGQRFTSGEWQEPGWGWVRTNARYLIFPAFALVTAVVTMPAIVRRRPGPARSGALFHLANLLFSVAMWTLWEFAGVGAIRGPEYVVYLIPPVFFALGALHCEAEHLPARTYLVLVTLAVVVGAWPFWDIDDVAGLARVDPLLVWPLAAAAFACLLPRCVAPGRAWTLAVFLLGIALAGWFARGGVGVGPSTHQPAAFARNVQAMRAVDAMRQGELPRFWYDESGPQGPDFRALNSIYLYMYSYLSSSFPRLHENRVVTPGMLAILVSRDADAVQKARDALQPSGLIPRVVESAAIGSGDDGYTLTAVRLERDPGRLVPLSARLEREADSAAQTLVLEPAAGAAVLPASGWHAIEGASLTPSAGAIDLTTHAEPFGYGALYPGVTVAVAGDYAFQFTYEIVSGRVDFGVVSHNNEWVCRAAVPALRRKVMTGECLATLTPGQPVTIVALNANPLEKRASRVTVFDVKSYQVRPHLGR